MGNLRLLLWRRLRHFRRAPDARSRYAYLSLLFVTALLTMGSGIPLLEERADARWGGEPEYEAYKANTPVLVPRPPRAG